MNASATGLVMGLKTKQAGMTPPAGYMGMTHQQYMPQYQRRTEFTPDEQELIRRNKGNVIPKIFTSQADSPAVDMASPLWSAAGGGLIGAALGAGAGSYLSTVAGHRTMGGALPGSPAMIGVGAAAGGIIGAIGSALSRRARNASIEEGMRRLPPGATRRDVEADPVYQATQDRAARIRAAVIAAGGSKYAEAQPGMDPATLLPPYNQPTYGAAVAKEVVPSIPKMPGPRPMPMPKVGPTKPLAAQQALSRALSGPMFNKVSSTQPGMDPLKATATGAGLGAAAGGALSFGDPGMMGRGALAGGSVGYLASAVDRIVARRQQRQRMEKPAGLETGVRPNVDVAGAAKNIYERAIQNMKQRPKAVATAAGAGLGAVVPGAIGYGLGSALGGLSNISETDPAVARKRRRRFALVGGLIGAAGGALRGAMLMNRPRGFPLPTPAKLGA